MTYYFKILVLSFFVPFIFSFHPKVDYSRNFKKLIISLPLTSLPFIVWDVIFTNIQVWGFNEEYHSSTYIFNLPLEEVLFFIFIPFCCMYTYHVIEKYKIDFFKNANLNKSDLYIAIVLLLISFFNIDKYYTFFCLSITAALLISNYFIFNKINHNYYYSTFLLLMLPFVIVNGALTGLFFDQIVVWYNPDQNLGIRFLTIPLEDFIYAHLLIFSNIIVYNYISNSSLYK